MSRSHVSNTTLSLGSTGEPATPNGKKMVWNRRKQQWIEVDVTEESPGKAAAASPTSSNALSSNAYASGVNQNAGNFLTDKPITRIHAPPGGASSISFGDQHTGPTAAAAGVTTKTQDQQGLVLGTPTQPTTPESAESTEEGPAPIPMMELPPAPPAVEEEVAEEEAAVVPPPAPEEVVEAEEAAAPSSAAAAVSSNAYASGSNQNSGNFMTGRPTTRVRAPPGGASSITFG
ncbi:unnamed protein product [Ectocarpus sp. 6 AP-2014]